jgi:hypothetical protein
LRELQALKFFFFFVTLKASLALVMAAVIFYHLIRALKRDQLSLKLGYLLFINKA